VQELARQKSPEAITTLANIMLKRDVPQDPHQGAA
jgi:hypothetical protein